MKRTPRIGEIPGRAARGLGAALCTLLLMTGCGGGGGGSTAKPAQTNSTPASPPADAGAVRVLFGDGPVDDFEQALFQIDEIRLLGAEGQEALVLKEPAEFDLLQLRNITEVMVDAEVPAGVYTEIRMKVRSIRLVRLDPYEEIPVPVPADGVVDLTPQRNIVVKHGEVVLLEVDVDLHRAIHTVDPATNRYRFRPVVFVNIIEQPEDGRYVRLYGSLDEIDGEGSALNVCGLDPLSRPQGIPGNDCYPVQVRRGALLVDTLGEPVDPEHLAALGEGQFATLLARWSYGRETAGGYFEAILVALGEKGIWNQRFGEITGEADDKRRLTLARDGTAEGDPGTVAGLLEGALIFDGDDELQGREAIDPGLDAELWGIAPAPGEQDPAFRTIVVYLDEPRTEHSVLGEQLSIDLTAGQLVVRERDLTEQCVQLTEMTRLYRISKADGKTAGARILLGQLSPDSDVVVQAYGTFQGACLTADELVLEAAVFQGD